MPLGLVMLLGILKQELLIVIHCFVLGKVVPDLEAVASGLESQKSTEQFCFMANCTD